MLEVFVFKNVANRKNVITAMGYICVKAKRVGCVLLSYMGGRGFLDLSLEMRDVFTFYSENRSDYAPGVVVAETTASTAPSIDPNGTVFPFQ